MNVHKLLLIARREYLYNIRRRAYLFTAFVIPVISIGFTLLASNVATSSLDDTGNYKRIGVVDQANLLSAVKLPAPYEIITSEAKAQAGLQDKSLDVYYVLPSDYLTTGQIESFSRESLAPGLDAQFGKLVRQSLAAKAGDPQIVARLEDPTPKIDIRRVGSSQVYDESVMFSAFFAPIIFGLLLYLSIMTTSQFLMSGVVEEKENRMMEVFATSTRPSEMLWGKILGLGALGLTQILIWGIMGLLFVIVRGTADIGSTLANLQLTPATALMMLGYFLLGYLFYGAVMAGLGASVSAEQESRQIAGLIGIVAVLPFFLIITFIDNPNGTLPTALSLFPVTAPIAMIMRVSFGTVPGWQIALSFGILAVSVAIVIWISARVFRLGMLSYGKRLSIRDMFAALREGRKVLTTSAAPKEAGVS